MKKFTLLLLACLLTMAGAAMAQQPVEQQTPTEKPAAQPAEKQAGRKGRGHAAEAQPGANQANPEAQPGKHRGGKNQQQATSTEQNPQQPPEPKQGAGHQRGRAKGQSGQLQSERAGGTQTTGADQSA